MQKKLRSMQFFYNFFPATCKLIIEKISCKIVTNNGKMYVNELPSELRDGIPGKCIIPEANLLIFEIFMEVILKNFPNYKFEYKYKIFTILNFFSNS